MDTLLCKWVIKAIEPSNSNFKLVLLFKLVMCKPPKHMKWGLEVNWALIENHDPFLGPKVWGKISKAWK